MRITNAIAEKYSKKFNINHDVVPFDEWKTGMQIELEHGKELHCKTTNVTNDNLKLTCMIVIAHLLEDPRYYRSLKKQEKRREKYWSTRTKPSIFMVKGSCSRKN